MGWQIIDSGIKSAEENMLLDEELLSSIGSDPILHFYDWEGDSATYGYFTNPAEYIDLDKAQKCGISFARRPTGGGIVFHKWDLAFSVLVPATSKYFSINTLDNYGFVNHAVLNAAMEFLQGGPLELTKDDGQAFDPSCDRFCMAKPTKYDVVLQGRKIAGAAQRKRRQGFLHQGTIALAMPDEDLKEVLLSPKVWEAMLAHTSPLLGQSTTQERIQEARQELKWLLQKHLT